jgi:hypothetical protein
MPKLSTALVPRAALIAALALAGCSPLPSRLENPLNGAQADLASGQGLVVLFSDPEARKDWVLIDPKLNAVTGGARTVKAATGAMGSESFEFTAAAAGQDELAFAYRADPKTPEPGEEIITVKVKVG